MSSGQPSLALQCREVEKRYGDTAVVQGLDLEVGPGEMCALLGPSGCGKTTTLRLISGFEQLDRGVITIAGREVARAGNGQGLSEPPERRRVGMVFQDYALFPHLSVRENVAFGLSRHERAAADAALALVGLDAYGSRMPGQLSGGQQQRVALARALAPQPDILLLDEPFSNLDASMRERVRTEVRNILRAAGATAILVTHDQDEAFTFADRLAIMLHGTIAQVGPPEEVYLSPRSREVADFLGDAQYLPGIAKGASAECVLGRVPLATAATGHVSLLVRPEALVLSPPDGDGAPGVVESRQFLGHSCVTTIALDGGETVTVRTDPYSVPHVGERVRVGLRGPA